jgi:hypothetical protein
MATLLDGATANVTDEELNELEELIRRTKRDKSK